MHTCTQMKTTQWVCIKLLVFVAALIVQISINKEIIYLNDITCITTVNNGCLNQMNIVLVVSHSSSNNCLILTSYEFFLSALILLHYYLTSSLVVLTHALSLTMCLMSLMLVHYIDITSSQNTCYMEPDLKMACLLTMHITPLVPPSNRFFFKWTYDVRHVGKIYFMKTTTISGVNLSAFIYRLFHEDFSWIVRMNIVSIFCFHSTDWGEIFMNQSVNKCR